MTLFEKIKALWTVRSVGSEIIKEAQMPTVSGKPGWQTTEFWLNVAAQLGVLWGAVKGFVPPQYAAMVTIGGVAIYTIARTAAKAVADIKAAKSAS